MSFLYRHRTICAVLQEIQKLAMARDDLKTIELCKEAIEYAQAMSARLVEYKEATKEGPRKSRARPEQM